MPEPEGVSICPYSSPIEAGGIFKSFMQLRVEVD